MSEDSNKPLAHCVYFTLNPETPDAEAKLLAGCQEFLTDHPGMVHFGAGPRATEYQRPVNDQTFDIALVLVFETKADHDRYQVSERHQQFISTCMECWSEVRVFDAFV